MTTMPPPVGLGNRQPRTCRQLEKNRPWGPRGPQPASITAVPRREGNQRRASSAENRVDIGASRAYRARPVERRNNMSRSPLRSWVGLVGVALLSSCGVGRSPGGPDEETATIVLAITTVPSDALCLEVSVTGAQTTAQLFGVVPGQSTTLVLQG